MTTNDEQYVPTDGPVRYQYVVNRMREGATRTHAEQEYTRWLAAHDARVRRDAAREAEARVAEEKHLRMKATAAATKAEARIEAVQDVLDRWQVDGYDALLRRIRRALDGDA